MDSESTPKEMHPPFSPTLWTIRVLIKKKLILLRLDVNLTLNCIKNKRESLEQKLLLGICFEYFSDTEDQPFEKVIRGSLRINIFT